SKSDSQLSLFLAQDRGYYKDEGLDVELIQIASAISVKALIGGSRHEFDGSTGSAMQAIINGAALKVIMISNTRAPWNIYSRPEIKTLQDLKGKRIAVTAIGSNLDQSAGRVLRNHGIDSQKDIIWQGVGPGTARITALQAGSIDAIVIDPLTAGDIESKGFNKLIELGDEARVLIGLVTTDKIIKEKPDVVKSVARAYTKAIKYYKELSPEARGWLEKQYAELGQPDKAMATKLYENMAKGWIDVRTITDAHLKQDIDSLREDLSIKQEFPVDAVFNLSFAKQAAQELEGWKP
ncbi:MAG: ABC transporter substrate-binding protein, partial [Dehalococcoidia bacterium]|nr:ABC transporter substrate-binding protein [Dehalococcoidia bacterium]